MSFVPASFKPEIVNVIKDVSGKCVWVNTQRKVEFYFPGCQYHTFTVSNARNLMEWLCLYMKNALGLEKRGAHNCEVGEEESWCLTQCRITQRTYEQVRDDLQAMVNHMQWSQTIIMTAAAQQLSGQSNPVPAIVIRDDHGASNSEQGLHTNPDNNTIDVQTQVASAVAQEKNAHQAEMERLKQEHFKEVQHLQVALNTMQENLRVSQQTIQTREQELQKTSSEIRQAQQQLTQMSQQLIQGFHELAVEKRGLAEQAAQMHTAFLKNHNTGFLNMNSPFVQSAVASPTNVQTPIVGSPIAPVLTFP
jgi:hypothetical protein